MTGLARQSDGSLPNWLCIHCFAFLTIPKAHGEPTGCHHCHEHDLIRLHGGKVAEVVE